MLVELSRALVRSTDKWIDRLRPAAFKSSKCRRDLNLLNIAATLPPEILLLIFSMLPSEPIYDSWPRWPISPKDLSSAALICASWRAPATTVLYRVIEVRTIRQLRLLHKTLVDYSYLQPLVKSLFLPHRFQATCPTPVVAQYQVLLQLLHSVDEISYQINKPYAQEQPIVGGFLGHDRNSNIRFLGLAGYTSEPYDLPPILTSFVNLRCLHITGFKIHDRVDPATTPPLLLLEEITVQVDNCFGLLDDWLCTLPRLRTICVAAIPSQPIPPTKLLQSNRISHLELVVCRTQTTYQGTWLGVSLALRILSITSDVFNSTYPEFPMDLDELKIWTVRYIELKMDLFIEYIKMGPRITTLTIIKDSHAEYFVDVQEELSTLCKQGGINLTVLSESCECKDCALAKAGPVEKAGVSKFLSSTFTAAGKIMPRRKSERAMSSDESEISRWEAAGSWTVEF